MSLWIMKEYVLSAETLLEEASSASRENIANGITGETAGESRTLGEPFLPDIFNFYSFLRRHPLVVFLFLINLNCFINRFAKNWLVPALPQPPRSNSSPGFARLGQM